MDYYLFAIILFLIGVCLFVWNIRRQTFKTVAKIDKNLILNKLVRIDEKELTAKDLETRDLCFLNPDDENESEMVCLTPIDLQILKNMESGTQIKDKFPYNANKLDRSICVENECINKYQLENMTTFWPKGAVFAFSGSKSAIPDGWAVCDGQNGTIDLRDKFIQGTDLKNIGVVSGQDKIPIEMENMPSHTHTFNMNNDGNGISGDSKGLFWGKTYSKVFDKKTGSNKWKNGNIDHKPTYQIKNHNDSKNKFGMRQNYIGGDLHNNMPPYYTLMYMQKII